MSELASSSSGSVVTTTRGWYAIGGALVAHAASDTRSNARTEHTELLARAVEGDRLAHQRLEGGRVDCFPFVDIERAAYVAVETRVEQTGGVLQRRALGEGQLHGMLVGFAGADDAVV